MPKIEIHILPDDKEDQIVVFSGKYAHLDAEKYINKNNLGNNWYPVVNGYMPHHETWHMSVLHAKASKREDIK